MKKTFLLLIMAFIFQNITNAQCPPYPVASGCGLAIPNCEGIDGYCNTLDVQIGITEPMPGCGGTAVINNDDWLAFYAGTEGIAIVITPSNCQSTGGNIGIQAAIYAACEESGGVNGDGLASEPLAEQCGCTTDPIMLSSTNFIIGQVYYLLIDGCGGDICDYEIDVVKGSTASFDITNEVAIIQGDSSFCSGDVAIFSIDSFEFAAYFDWTTDSTANIISGQGTSEVEIAIEAEGDIEICVTPSNGCFVGLESCITVNSLGVNQTTTFVELLCEGDSIEFESQFYSESGFYSEVYTNSSGCDSILNLDLTIYPEYEIILDVSLCEGIGYEFGDSIYTESGNYENLLTSSQGCDSTLYLNLEIVTSFETVLEDTICEGVTYPIWGFEFSESGEYSNELESQGGCDSTVYLYLVVLPPPDTHIEVTICEGGTVEIGGITYSEPGTYTQTDTDSTGCLMTTTLVLDVIPTILNTIDTSFQSGGFYNGIAYSNDTTIVENYIASNGCDSIVTVNIMVVPLGISLPDGIDQLFVFPNPTSNQFYIQLELSEVLDLQLDIYNTLGQKLSNLSSKSSYTSGKHSLELDASQLPNGTYFLHIQTDKGNINQKLVVSR